jgi:hypothetical protein
MNGHQDRAQVALIAEQIGSALEPDTDQYINRFLVKSTSSSSMHRVSQKRSDGTWCCSCRGWTMHVDAQGRRKCRHLTDILGRLAALPAQQAAEMAPSVVAMLASARTAYLDIGGAAPLKVKLPQTGRQLDF